MQNSKYAPASFQEYSAKDLNTNLRGCHFNCAPNQTTINDYVITDDCLLDGANLHTINANLGDKITAQVIDKDNIFGYGHNVVLGQYVTDWFINPMRTEQLDYTSRYPAKIFAGLYLRIIYTSTSNSVPVDVIVNYKLHKILW